MLEIYHIYQFAEEIKKEEGKYKVDYSCGVQNMRLA